jgi:membrane protein
MIAKRVVHEFQQNNLNTWASAIAFQLMTALVPLALLACGLAGFLSLQSVWTDDLAPQVKSSVSGPAYQVLDQTVKGVLQEKRALWVTIGALIAIWQLSGAVRASMGALDRVYHERQGRSIKETWDTSLWLSAAGAALVFVSVAVVSGLPLLVGDLGPLLGPLFFIVRWLLGGAVLLLAVWLLVHYGTAHPQPVRWASLGSLLVVGLWAVTSIAFVGYFRLIAHNSLFGHLVSLVVLIGYLYATALAFMLGVQADAVIRESAGAAAEQPRPDRSASSPPPARRAAQT